MLKPIILRIFSKLADTLFPLANDVVQQNSLYVQTLQRANSKGVVEPKIQDSDFTKTR